MALDTNTLPVAIDLPKLIRGDAKTYRFFADGVCWTTEEPAPETLDPEIPWVKKYWWAEARSNYATASRYHNGWVPWYGNPPSTYVWWVQYSLGAIFRVTAEWDSVKKGTVVSMHIDSSWSKNLRAVKYSWSVRSGDALTEEGDGTPLTFGNYTTWAKGKLPVEPGYTILPIIPGTL